jgi:hypothetical protein
MTLTTLHLPYPLQMERDHSIVKLNQGDIILCSCSHPIYLKMPLTQPLVASYSYLLLKLVLFTLHPPIYHTKRLILFLSIACWSSVSLSFLYYLYSCPLCLLCFYYYLLFLLVITIGPIMASINTKDAIITYINECVYSESPRDWIWLRSNRFISLGLNTIFVVSSTILLEMLPSSVVSVELFIVMYWNIDRKSTFQCTASVFMNITMNIIDATPWIDQGIFWVVRRSCRFIIIITNSISTMIAPT